MQAGDEIVKLASGPGADDGRRDRRAALPPGTPAPAAPPSAPDSCAQPRLASLVQALLDRRAGRRQRRPGRDQPASGLARLPPADRHGNRPRERVRDLHPPRRTPTGRRSRRRGPGSTSPSASSPTAAQRPLLRNYSLSGPPGRRLLPDHASSANATARPAAICTRRLGVGDQLDIAAPRGTFILDDGHAPVLLITAGIGATPALAMLHALAARALRAGDLVAARRTQRQRPLLRRRGARAPRVAPERPHATSATAARAPTTSRAATSTAPAASPRRCSTSSRRRAMPRPTSAVRSRSWKRSARPGGDRDRRLAHPHRALRARAGSDARHRGDPCADAAPARRPARNRPDDRVRPQQPRHSVEQRLRQPARARRGLRRARPLVVPHRRLPQLRDDAHRRRARLPPRPRRTARRRQRAHLLLAAARRRRARSVRQPVSHLRLRGRPS